MPVYKDDSHGTWYVKFQFTDSTGKVIYKTKRGFALKREAAAWEENEKLSLTGDSGMAFGSFAAIYKKEHLSRLRPSVAYTKNSMIDKMILPYFRDMPVNEISEIDIMKWQNQLLKPNADGEIYSQSYLYTMNALLGTMFSYAMKNYGLKENPVKKAGSIGTLKRNGDAYWTLEEYRRFLSTVKDGSDLYFAFEILYWTGIRKGELLALTPSDFIAEDDVLDINKTLHVLDGKEYIAPPKSKDGCRRVKLPHSLTEELQEYLAACAFKDDERIFSFSKTALLQHFAKGIESAGLPKITIHGLRHSHVSLLISLGFNPVAIAARVGHKSSYVTLRYAHARKGVQERMADALNNC